MFSNQFTDALEANNWVQYKPMSFMNVDMPDIEIFFDNSNQVEVYYQSKIKFCAYLKNLDDVKELLKTIP